VVLEAFSAGWLDVGERQLDPWALVQRALPVDLPAHALVIDHDCDYPLTCGVVYDGLPPWDVSAA
jgi:hypothetical protein